MLPPHVPMGFLKFPVDLGKLHLTWLAISVKAPWGFKLGH